MANTQNTNDQDPNNQTQTSPVVAPNRSNRHNYGHFNQRGRRAVRDGRRLDESGGELMYLIFGKLEPNAFEDRLTTIEDYFDWFDVSNDRKVRYVRMKLKGMHKHGGEVWKNNKAVHDDQQFLTRKR
ncbi:hypothetical protein AAG906_005770 [Vitis piasezkii]